MECLKICINCGKTVDSDAEYCKECIMEMEIREQEKEMEM